MVMLDQFNPLKPQSNGLLYNNTVIGTLALMGELLHLVQRVWAWAGYGPAQSLLAVPNLTTHPSMPMYLLHIIRRGTIIVFAL